MAESAFAPQPVLTDFRLFGFSVIPGRRSPLKVAINRTSAIELSRSENVFSIEFSALAYLNPGTNRYRYMLDGVDKDWREVGSDERLATYTTLPAGNHTFRLEAATSRGPWSSDMVLAIKILPPFWQAYWFLTCSTAGLLGVLGLLYRLRLNQLSARFNMRVDERVGERTRIAQELHLTLVQNITGLSLQISGLAKTVSEPDYVKEQLQDLRHQTDDCLREARQSNLGHPGHFGLSTMRERAARVRGSIKIRSGLGQGTSIEVSAHRNRQKR